MAKHAMTAEQFLWLQAYVDRCKDLYGLRDFDVRLASEYLVSDDGAQGAIDVNYPASYGKLMVAPGFFSIPAQDQRHFIVHELTHAHMVRWDDVLQVVRPLLSKRAYRSSKEAFWRAEERVVDAVATGVAHLFPLPKKCPRDRG